MSETPASLEDITFRQLSTDPALRRRILAATHGTGVRHVLTAEDAVVIVSIMTPEEDRRQRALERSGPAAR